jgi:hypothetical protein
MIMSVINSEDVRQYINTKIRTNGRKQINGATMNTALNGLLQLAETRQGSGIIVQNYPTPTVFKEREPGSIWLQPLKGALHLIDETGAWLYLQLPLAAVFSDERNNWNPNANQAIECLDLALSGLREAINYLGMPGSSVAVLFQKLKELAAQRLLKKEGKTDLFIVADKPGEKKALLADFYGVVAGAAFYYDPLLTAEPYVDAAWACQELAAEQPQLLQEGGMLHNKAGKQLLAGLLVIIANGINDMLGHPKSGNAAVELLPEQSDRSMAIAIIASYFDRISSALS